MLRRIAAAVFALALVSLAPAPLSACALAAHLPGNCPCNQSKSLCDRMMQVHATCAASGQHDWNCCHVSQAPLPEMQSHPPLPVVALPVRAVGAAIALARLVPAWPGKEVRPAVSPPDQQALYCVFLV